MRSLVWQQELFLRRVAVAVVGAAVWGAGCREARAPPRSEAASPAAGRPVSAVSEKVFRETDLGVERRLPPGGTNLYRMDLEDDRFLHVRIDQRGSDVSTRLVDPDGRVLIEVDSHTGNQDPEHLYFVTETA